MVWCWKIGDILAIFGYEFIWGCDQMEFSDKQTHVKDERGPAILLGRCKGWWRVVAILGKMASIDSWAVWKTLKLDVFCDFGGSSRPLGWNVFIKEAGGSWGLSSNIWCLRVYPFPTAHGEATLQFLLHVWCFWWWLLVRNRVKPSYMDLFKIGL